MSNRAIVMNSMLENQAIYQAIYQGKCKNLVRRVEEKLTNEVCKNYFIANSGTFLVEIRCFLGNRRSLAIRLRS